MARILIVDDSKTSRKMLRGILEDAGMEVVGEAVNGEEAVALFPSVQPDLVTLDITMPVMDGICALTKILEIDNQAKVIMVTAAGQKGNVVEALKKGASEFVTKPYDADAILEVVHKILGA
ncbi:MAG: response regulator [Lachnospiraceae bacterium]